MFTLSTKYALQLFDALALEMEGYGFLKAAHAHSGLEALVVRGISDLLEGKADADKGGSQERASRHAAAFAFQVLAKLSILNKGRIMKPFFFGREKELQSIAEAISPEARTWGALIDGPGGIGKTASLFGLDTWHQPISSLLKFFFQLK
jgi:hypothetical protein